MITTSPSKKPLSENLGHGLQDVLIGIGTNLDVTGLGKTRERALVAVPIGE